MDLVILPGGGNPSHPSYQGVYELLRSKAALHGYDSVDITARWRGHFKEGQSYETGVTLDGAVEAASEFLDEHEQVSGDYAVLGRSFGTLVAAQCALSMRLESLQRLIFWGPPPYWILWRMWKRDLDESQKEGHKKGVHFDESFFPSLVPFETMLPQLNKPAVVATGGDDDISSPTFLEYLESTVPEQSNVVFRVVEGVPHAVDAERPESAKRRYAEALFSE